MTRPTDTSRAAGVIGTNAAVIVTIVLLVGSSGLLWHGNTSRHDGQPWTQIGTRPIVYDQASAQHLLFVGAAGEPARRIEVLDSGLNAARGIAAVPTDGETPPPCRGALVRLVVADAWEALYEYRVLGPGQHPPGCLTDRRPRRLPADLEPCPGGICDDVDHRDVAFVTRATGPGLVVGDAHQRRVSLRDMTGHIAGLLGGTTLLDGVTALTSDGGTVFATTVPSQAERERAQRTGMPAGRLFELTGNASREIAGDLDRPVGVAYAPPCGAAAIQPGAGGADPRVPRLYLSDANEEHTVWYYYERRDGTWLRAGVLATESADRGATLPVLQGIAIAKCRDNGSQMVGGQIFAAGPGGLYVYRPDGALVARYVLGQRIAGLTWGGDGALYMTIGHRIARLLTKVGEQTTS